MDAGQRRLRRLVIILLVNLVATDNFVTVSNLRTQLIQVVPVVIVAIGMAW